MEPLYIDPVTGKVVSLSPNSKAKWPTFACSICLQVFYKEDHLKVHRFQNQHYGNKIVTDEGVEIVLMTNRDEKLAQELLDPEATSQKVWQNKRQSVREARELAKWKALFGIKPVEVRSSTLENMESGRKEQNPISIVGKVNPLWGFPVLSSNCEDPTCVQCSRQATLDSFSIISPNASGSSNEHNVSDPLSRTNIVREDIDADAEIAMSDLKRAARTSDLDHGFRNSSDESSNASRSWNEDNVSNPLSSSNISREDIDADAEIALSDIVHAVTTSDSDHEYLSSSEKSSNSVKKLERSQRFRSS